MAGAGGLDAIQTMLTSSINYSLYHVEDRFVKAENHPVRGTHRPGDVVMAKDLDVPVPVHPANTGGRGMHGRPTRNLSETQNRKPAGLCGLVESRPMNAGTQIYTIDPLGKSSKMPFLQKGTWTCSKGTNDPPALARHWAWSHERNVQTNLSDTAFTYSKVDQGWKRPIWGMHFGQIGTRPTFGKLKCPQSAHQSPATLAHEMSMDKALFSPFRTTVQPPLSMLPSRSVTPMRMDMLGPGSHTDCGLSHTDHGINIQGGEGAHERSGQASRASRSRASRGTLSPEVQSMDDLRSEPETGAGSFDTQQQNDVFSILSGVDFGRVASPAFGQNTSNKVILARSCGAIDGIQRSLIVLPDRWGPIKHMIKDEVTARTSLLKKTQRLVLAQAPKNIMRHLHAQMRAHPDTPWQPTCFPVVQ